MRTRVCFMVGAAMFLFSHAALRGDDDSTWRKPPEAILSVLHAPDAPVVRVSPTGDTLALTRVELYPPLADLAAPMLRLAGVRINPKTNGRHGETVMTDLALLRVADRKEQRISLPARPRMIDFEWSADGRRFAFLNESADAVDLWVGRTDTGEVRQVPDVKVNPVLDSELSWMPDQRTLLVKRVPPLRAAAPATPATPPGPRVQASAGQSASSTYEARDVLKGPADEALFEHYASSQLALVDADTAAVTPLGEPAVLGKVESSPGGEIILVERIEKPWSYSLGWHRFPRAVEVWDRAGKVVHTAARLPLADQVPIDGEPEGPREHTWRSTEPATLVWLEALDKGDPGREAAYRDRVMLQRAPFETPAREVHKAPHRVQSMWWGEKDGLLLIQEFERERRWRHVSDVNADDPAARPRRLFDLSANERYASPGSPVTRRLSNGASVLAQDGDAIFLSGQGSTPTGDRPFLDRFSLRTTKSERLFRSGPSGYERFMAWLDIPAGAFLTRRESAADPPNYFARTLTRRARAKPTAGEARWNSVARPLTSFPDPAPQLRGITQRIVTYKRADGTPLSFKLYLPPGYKEGSRLPTVLEAYPLEYSDPATAGQVSASDQQFLRIVGPSSLFFLLDGYAVLAEAAMPVIGDPDTAYDTFNEQIVASAAAAIDKAVEMGVTDRGRVGVMGHSHGGLMTAALLARSDIFRAGIARSGAYNHTIRPFGFQNERRTLWQARETYLELSPVMFADRINEPLLLIHGEVDRNPGTVPLQSEKLFEAVRGTGGTARLVMLPCESHSYRSAEAVEDVLAEQVAWLDRYVKNAADEIKK